MVTERDWKNILTVQGIENLIDEVNKTLFRSTKPVSVQKNNNSSEKHRL